MSKKFYNSVEWGIQTKNINQIRNNGFEFLEKIGCKTCKNYSLKIEEIIKQTSKVKEFLNGKIPYLVVFESSDKEKKKIGKFNVKGIREVYEIINSISAKDWAKYRVSFVEQIKPLENSFSGTAVSDGKGKLLIEFIMGTTDSRELTSCGADPRKIDYCYFSDFETISKMSDMIPLKFIEKIKESCHFFKGYYEFVYGISNNEDDIYFTFYSNINKYLNVLDKYNENEFSEEIESRLIYNQFKEMKYYNSRIKKENKNDINISSDLER